MTTQKSSGTQEKGKRVLSVTEAAEALGISRPTLYTLLHRSDFPSFRIGNRVLISMDGLHRWVAAQASGTEGAE